MGGKSSRPPLKQGDFKKGRSIGESSSGLQQEHAVKNNVPAIRTPNVRKDVRFSFDSENNRRSSTSLERKRSKEDLGWKKRHPIAGNPFTTMSQRVIEPASSKRSQNGNKLQLSSLMLRTPSGLHDGAVNKEVDTRSTIIFIFFMAYFSSRYAVWLATDKIREISVRRGLQISAAVFAVSSVWGIAANKQASYLLDKSTEVRIRDIILTSALVATGAYAGANALPTIISGIVCGLWTMKFFSLSVNVTVCAGYGVHLVGSIVGGIATGNAVTDSHVSTGVTHGVILGLVVSIIVGHIGGFVGVIVEELVNTCLADLPLSRTVGFTDGIGGGLTSWFINGLIKGIVIGFPSGFVGSAVALVLGVSMAVYFVHNNKTLI